MKNQNIFKKVEMLRFVCGGLGCSKLNIYYQLFDLYCHGHNVGPVYTSVVGRPPCQPFEYGQIRCGGQVEWLSINDKMGRGMLMMK